jgi:8-oxo-dGTP pyrophosphatase MutT (NUDIX family)
MNTLASAAQFSWPGFLVNAAAISATIVSLGALFTVVETLLRRWPRFRRWMLSAPLRVATPRRRRSPKDRVEPDDLVILAEEFGSIRHFRRVMIRLLFRGENTQAAGFILADLLAEPPASSGRQHEQPQPESIGNGPPDGPTMLSASLRGEHHWTRLAPVLLRVFSVAAWERSTRLVARILYPEDVRIYSALFSGLAQALQELAVSAPVAFERYLPAVGEELDERRGKSGFASFVTAFTGSIVLADAAEARSMCAEQVLVWHSRRFHRDLGSHQAQGSTDYLSWRYEDTHRDGVGCTQWGGTRPRRIGDFDQRVLHLRSVALAEATAENGLSIVLETSETCYGITETGAAGMGCKDVTVRLGGGEDPDDPVFYRRSRPEAPSSPHSTSDYRIARKSPDIGRVTLLTVQLALISADDKLVLQDRAAGVRHDASLIGASAGGVISLGGIIPSGDLDPIGWPDPTAAVMREAREETGVVLPPDSCRPLCVYLLNLRDAGSGGQIAPGGQLGAAVLYLARTPLDSHEIETSAKVSSDQARGRFEHSGLAFCPLERPEHTAAWIADHATRLTVHALMACAYASMITFGRQQTETALGDAFADGPWWTISPYAQPVPRLVRDPRRLMRGGYIDEISPQGWAAAWRRLGPDELALRTTS